jgi:hypothetical protein
MPSSRRRKATADSVTTFVAQLEMVSFVEIAHRWHIPGLEECNLLRLVPALGVQQTRNISGGYVLTPEDL